MTENRRAFSEFLTRAGTPLLTPKGMGDLLPPAAAARRALSQTIVKTFGLAGYELVTPPLFEHASVVERGNESVDPRDLLRFVEPESGEVAVLRPDITPQVARMVATRLTDHPAPFRLCYEGRVLRRRRGRARKHQQIAQVGVECIGIDTPAGDVEIIALASDACGAVGLANHRIEVGDVRLVSSVLADVRSDIRDKVAELIAIKDEAALRAMARDGSIAARTRDRLLLLLEHCGELSVLARARRKLRWDAARTAIDNLIAITERLCRLGFETRLGVDLGETRGLSYYTGISFQILAEGPGEAICSGGRYDNLLARFGTPYPATGFALDLANLQWALRVAGNPFGAAHPTRALVAGGAEIDREQTARQLRLHGMGAAPATGQNLQQALAFANRWGYAAVLVLGPRGTRAIRTADGARRSIKQLDSGSISTLAAWAEAIKE